jgi:endoglucanase
MLKIKISLNIIWVIVLLSSVCIQAQVYINQAGYLNNLPKIFYSIVSADSFSVIEIATQQEYFSGPMELYYANDPATGLNLYQGDFSSLQREGIYYIRTNLNDTSYTFSISSNAFTDVYKKSLKGFYYQRCGTALLQTNAGVYSHPNCHLNDGVYHSSTGQTGSLNTTGGWHDAGDYGKYIVNAGISAGTLLMAYESFPQYFSYDDLNIPESGNGVPDILDEVRYELNWFLKMQNPNGGIYFKVTKTNFESFIMPNNDSGTRYIYQISSSATADFAAVMARASRLFSAIDSTFANQCLTAATLAWDFLAANPTIIPAGGLKNPTGTVTGEYGDTNDKDERLWAAAELFETTGNSIYKTYFDSNFSQGGIINSSMNWGNVKPLAQITYLKSTQSGATVTVKNQIKNSLISYCNSLVIRHNLNGFGITVNPGEYYWGSNSDVLNKAIILIFGFAESGNINYKNTALAQLNYILGTNAHNLSFITGVGSNSIMHPHHRPSASDGVVNPVPGLLSGGPNEYLNDPVLQSLFNSSTPPALCFVDNVDSYASNEIAINWNAPLVFIAGYFNGDGLTSVEEQGFLTPEKFQLEQNYPNPFNPTTNINYKVPFDSFVSIKVYDALGKHVDTIVNMQLDAGEYHVVFDATKFASGVYFYQLRSENLCKTNKMILLK